MSGYSSWAAVAAGKAKATPQGSDQRTNDMTTSSTGSQAPLSIAPAVANLASSLSNMSVAGPSHSGHHPPPTQVPTLQSAAPGRGHGRGRGGRGLDRGTQHPALQPHVIPTPQQNQPASAWGINTNNHQVRAQSGRGGGGSGTQPRVVHTLSSQAQPTPAMGMNIAPTANNHNAQTQSGGGGRGGAKSRGKKWAPVRLESALRSVRGISFHPFQRLPAELRLKIWKLYLGEDRLIEIERGRNYEENDPEAFLDHGARRVSPRSRLPPLILQINKEVRAEFLKEYQRVCFDSSTRNHKECTIYFNPAYDILFFGQNACITSIIHIFQMAHHKEIDIPRIAIHASGTMTECCDWIAEDDYAIDRNRGVWSGCNLPQALHGICAKVNNEEKPTITGGRGLTDVFFVQPSMFWGLEAGQIDGSVAFRPAVGNGITAGQKRFKETMTRMIDGVEAEEKLRGVGDEDGDNKWVGDKKPKFSFVSMIPKLGGGDQQVYDSVVVKSDEYNQLIYGPHRAIINAASKANNCFLTWCKYDYRGQAEREIGLLGMAEDNKKMKAVFEERLVKLKEVVETTEG